MTPEMLIEFLAIINKMKIESNDNLTNDEKEFLKSCIDELKRSASKSEE